MRGENSEEIETEELPELASLSNRFSYFENFKDKEHANKKGEEMESDMARRECKASSVLNKFKEMENRVLNGEPEGNDLIFLHYSF